MSVAFAIAFAPACDSGKCGTGTVRYGDTCVTSDPFDKTPPVLTIDPPLYTRSVGTVHITSDKPATIYYTLDGNPATTSSKSGADEVVIPNVTDDGAVLRTFAIDLAGNKSDEVVRVWVIDRDGPGQPLDLRLTLGADQATRTVTWGMPPDPRPGGMVIARVDGKLGPGPESGKTYNVGDTLGPGMTVVAVNGADPTGMFSEVLPASPGLVRYVGWAFDNLDNYGPPSADYKLVPMPAQTAMVTIDKTTGNVTIANAPATLGLYGNASITTGTMTLNLSLKNTTSRPLFAPKLQLTNLLPAGVTWSDSSGMIGTVPYRSYGSALNSDASNTEIWTFSGITGTGTLSLALSFREDPVLTAASWEGPPIVDSATGVDLLDMPSGATGKGSSTRVLASAITPDGVLITAQRESCKVISYSVASARELAAASLCSEFGHVAWLVTDHGGSVVYAVISDERPKIRYHAAPVPTQLVRLDATTLAEYGPRIDLGMSMTRGMRLSPDDRTLVIGTATTAGGIIVVDTSSFKIKRRIIPDFKPQTATLSPDGKSIAAVGDSMVAVYTVDGDLLLKRPAPGTPTGSGETRVMAAFSSPTVLWFARISELDSLDLITGDVQTFAYEGTCLEVFDGKVYTYGPGYNNPGRFDMAGNQEVALPDLFASGRGHFIGRSPF